MTRLVIVLIFCASCAPPAPPSTATRHQQLVTYCSSSAECTSNPDGCRYCYNAHCSCVLPAEPVGDAGIDAAPGGTTP